MIFFFFSHVLQTQEGIGSLLGTDMEINFCCHKFGKAIKLSLRSESSGRSHQTPKAWDFSLWVE